MSAEPDRVPSLRSIAFAMCTVPTARWCPVHGDCVCAGDDLDDAACPLHAPGSTHAEEAPAPVAPADVAADLARQVGDLETRLAAAEKDRDMAWRAHEALLETAQGATEDLRRERDEQKARASEMHRRAQKSEGAEARVERLRESHRREVNAARRYYAGRTRGFIEMIRVYTRLAQSLGAPDDHPDPHTREGRLDVFICRLAMQRDAALAALETRDTTGVVAGMRAFLRLMEADRDRAQQRATEARSAATKTLEKIGEALWPEGKAPPEVTNRYIAEKYAADIIAKRLAAMRARAAAAEREATDLQAERDAVLDRMLEAERERLDLVEHCTHLRRERDEQRARADRLASHWRGLAHEVARAQLPKTGMQAGVAALSGFGGLSVIGRACRHALEGETTES